MRALRVPSANKAQKPAILRCRGQKSPAALRTGRSRLDIERS